MAYFTSKIYGTDVIITHTNRDGSNLYVEYLIPTSAGSPFAGTLASTVLQQSAMSDPTIRLDGAESIFIADATVGPTSAFNGVVNVSIVNTPNVSVTNIPSIVLSGVSDVNLTNIPSVVLSGTPAVNVTNIPSVVLSGTSNVSVTNIPSVVLSGTPDVNIANTPTVTTNQIRSGTSTVTQLSAVSTNVTALSANTSRITATFYNESPGNFYVKFGQSSSSSDYSIKISTGTFFQLPLPTYTGFIDCFSDSVSGYMLVTEFT